MSITNPESLPKATMVEVKVPPFSEDPSRSLHGSPATVSVDRSILRDRVWLMVKVQGQEYTIGLTRAEALAIGGGLLRAVVEGGFRTLFATLPPNECE